MNISTVGRIQCVLFLVALVLGRSQVLITSAVTNSINDIRTL